MISRKPIFGFLFVGLVVAACANRPVPTLTVQSEPEPAKEAAIDRSVAAENLSPAELKSKFGTNIPILTEAELKAHRERMPEFSKIASACVQKHLEDHQSFHEAYGVSNYIGVNTRILVGKNLVPLKSRWKEGESDAKLQELVVASYADWEPKNKQLKKQATIGSADKKRIKNMSCIGMTINCMKEAFVGTNQAGVYEKFITYYRKPGKAGIQAYTGHPMILGLKYGFGWKVAYWNPNPSEDSLKWMDTAPGDPPFRNHKLRYEEVLSSNSYYKIPVDLLLVGEEEWGQDHRQVPKLLQSTPFGVFGTTDFYHVGPFSKGQITEAHAGMMWFAQNSSATDYEKSKRVIESNPFSPFATNGAPRGHYPTGIVAIPPN